MGLFLTHRNQKKVLESITQGQGIDSVERIDMTLPDAAVGATIQLGDELVLVGAPVYAGRLPKDAAARFKRCLSKKDPLQRS